MSWSVCRSTIAAERRDADPAGLAAFTFLAFAIAWACWLPNIVAGSAAGPGPLALRLAGGFGPTLAAVSVLLWRGGGKAAHREVIRPLASWTAPGRWVAAALLVPPLLHAAAALFAAMATGVTLPDPGALRLGAHVGSLPAVLVLGGPLGEELGWRGYALPRLERLWGPVGASFALGTVWAIWHVPLFLQPGGQPQALPFPLFFVVVVAHTLIMTWLYFGSGGSLLLALFYHASLNVAGGMSGDLLAGVEATATYRVAYVVVVVTAAAAVTVLARRRVARRSASPR